MGNAQSYTEQVAKYKKKIYSVKRLLDHSKKTDLAKRHFKRCLDFKSGWSVDGKDVKWSEIIKDLKNYPEIHQMIKEADENGTIIVIADEKYAITGVVFGIYTMWKLYIQNRPEVNIKTHWVFESILNECEIDYVS
jgi:hypothetical protein